MYYHDSERNHFEFNDPKYQHEFLHFFKNGETFQKKVKQEGKRDLHHRHDDTPASTRQQVSAVKLIEFSYFKPFTSKI